MGALDEPKAYIMGIIVFTAFIMGGMMIVNEARNNTPDFFSANDSISIQDFNKTFSKLDELNAGGLSVTSGTDLTSDAESSGIISSLVNTAWTALKTLKTSFSFMDDIFDYGLQEWLVLPAWVGSLIKMTVLVMIMFALYAAGFKV